MEEAHIAPSTQSLDLLPFHEVLQQRPTPRQRDDIATVEWQESSACECHKQTALMIADVGMCKGLRMEDGKSWTYPNLCERQKYIPKNKTLIRRSSEESRSLKGFPLKVSGLW